MRLSMIVTPFTGENLHLAAQGGVEEMVANVTQHSEYIEEGAHRGYGRTVTFEEMIP